MAYDNAVYGMKFRQWFGLPDTFGSVHTGDAATSGFALGSGSATHVASWYPSKPIKITGFGVRAIVAVSTSGGTKIPGTYFPAFLGRQGFRVGQADFCNTEAIASLHFGVLAKAAVASIHTMASKSLAVIPVGSLVCIKTGSITAPTVGTTNSSSSGGQVAFFIDYSPQYSTVSDDYWTD